MTTSAHPTHQSSEVPSALINALTQARRVVVFTGAGMSAESDIPTFRDAMHGLCGAVNLSWRTSAAHWLDSLLKAFTNLEAA